MSYQQKPNSGSLFKNERKQKDTHPNATGTALIECPCCKAVVSYFVDAWTKEGSKGKFQSLKFKPKERQQRQEQQSNSDSYIP